MRTSLALGCTALGITACLGMAQRESDSDVASLTGAAAAGACVDVPSGLHVATNGSDAASGAAGAPLRTIAAALARANAGDTVVVHAGTYKEQVVFPRSGTAGKPITLRAPCGERPVLDGTTLPTGDLPSLVTIADRAFVTLDGFLLENLRGSGDSFPAGIWIRGASHDIVVRNNVIRQIRAAGGPDAGAHGIGIYGTSTTPLENVLLEANELSNLVLGPSEAIAFNGNVRHFTVRGNSVHDADNIAFDFIGYEGTCEGCRGDDLASPSVDRVRDGVVSGNLAFNVSSKGNPAYGSERSAGCFYVDGGGRIVIERNTAHHCDLGVELASEHAGKSTREVVVRNNFFFANFVTGIATGGYSSGTGAGGGTAEACRIVHNTIVDSSQDSWALTGVLLQNRNVGNTYVDNLIVASSGHAAFKIDGAGNSANAIDHNLYRGGGVVGAAAGAGSVTDDPKLVAPATGNLHLSAGSPAIGAGSALDPAIGGTVDIDGDPRGNDIGADQRTAAAPDAGAPPEVIAPPTDAGLPPPTVDAGVAPPFVDAGVAPPFVDAGVAPPPVDAGVAPPKHPPLPTATDGDFSSDREPSPTARTQPRAPEAETGAETTARPTASSGCSAAPGSSGPAGLAFPALVGMLLARRRRRP